MNNLCSLLPWVPLPRTAGPVRFVLPHTLAWPYPCSCSIPAVHAQLLVHGSQHPKGPAWPWGGEGGQLPASPESSSSQGVGGFTVERHGASCWLLSLQKCSLSYSG